MKYFDNFLSFQELVDKNKNDLYSGSFFSLTPNAQNYYHTEVPCYGSLGSIGFGLLMSHHKMEDIISLMHIFPQEIMLFDFHVQDITLAVDKNLSLSPEELKVRKQYLLHLNGVNNIKAKNTHYAKKSFEFKTQNTNFLNKDIFHFIDNPAEIYNILLNKLQYNMFSNYCYNAQTKMCYYQQPDFRFFPLTTLFIDLKKNSHCNLNFAHLEGSFGNCNTYGEKYMTLEDLQFLYRIYSLDKERENALIFPNYLYEKFQLLEEKYLLEKIVNPIQTRKSLNKI